MERFSARVVLGVLMLSASFGQAAQPEDVVIDDTYVFPESITATARGELITGSAKGILYRAERGATHAKPWVRPSPENELLSVLGVLADDKNRTLWLCSVPSPFPVAPKAPPGAVSSLMAFDLSTGQRKASYPFPPPASACNDIAIAKDGTVYATDTPNGRIFKVAPGSKQLQLHLEDAQLKGIDGIVFSSDGVMYANIVTRGALLRIDGSITELKLSQPVKGPDGFRLIEGRRFLLAEGNGGRIDEVTIDGDSATVKVLRDGLTSPPGVTLMGRTAYAIEGKIGYLIDPKLKGQDPGVFRALAIPLNK
jgi:sugar lactone lactonase YvrE